MATTTATHVCAALIEGPITTRHLVVKACEVPLTQEHLDAAHKEVQQAVWAYVTRDHQEGVRALNRAYVALGTTNPSSDVDLFCQGKHPVWLARFGLL